jgi:glucokinase
MSSEYAIGVDIGGTKCAAGLVRVRDGEVVSRRLQPTAPERGAEAILTEVAGQIQSLAEEGRRLGAEAKAAGVGIAELVSPEGRVLSGATIPWREVEVAVELRKRTGLAIRLEADVRAAARAEARLGAGREFSSFLYVTVGTGISASLVIGGVPYVGARGLTGTFASGRGLAPSEDGTLTLGAPLEQFAAGPAIAARYAAASAARNQTPHDATEVIALAEQGDQGARCVVETAGRALGAALAQLTNMFDPEAIVLGGGLGLVGGVYRESVLSALQEYVWSEFHRDIPLRSAALGIDSGLIGAAMAASDPSLCSG